MRDWGVLVAAAEMKWHQFSLRSLFVLMLIVALGSSCIAWQGPSVGTVAHVLLSVLVGATAQVFAYRSFLGWVILSLLISPCAAIVFLLIAGTPLSAAQTIREHLIADEQRSMAEDERHAEYRCPSCSNPINLVTGKGIQEVEDEPWRLVCANCQYEIDADQLDP